MTETTHIIQRCANCGAELNRNRECAACGTFEQALVRMQSRWRARRSRQQAHRGRQVLPPGDRE